MTSRSRYSRPLARPGLSSSEPVGYHNRAARPLEGPRPRGGTRHNLPHLPSSFIGRDDDIVYVAGLLGQRRLVTLTGPGGMGKTRLAVKVAMGLVPQFPSGIWFVELAAVSDPKLLTEALGAVLPGSKTRPGSRSTANLAGEIGDQSMLLVIDNCEHLVEPCGQLVDFLLRSCPGVSVLATSREALGVGGEHRWLVGPLSLPASAGADAAAVQESQAGQLFIQRATAGEPSFQLTEKLAPTVAEICRRLDGMPLAIELAAARTASLSAVEVLARLDDRFRLLTTAGRTGPHRHQTLSATLEWSHDLLSAAQATLLRRVSVFADWSLEAAQEVCSGGEVQRDEVIDHLRALESKSLVVVETREEPARFRLLETVRMWARSKLETAPEAEAVARNHASWCLALAERAQNELFRTEPQAWLGRLDVEHDNLRAALEWARTTKNFDLGVPLAATLATFWRTRGHMIEGQGWLEWALSESESSPPLVRANLLRETGLLRGMLGDITAALPLLEESSALFATAGDHDGSLCVCNSMFHMFRNPRPSLPGLQEEVDRCRSTGDDNRLAHFLWALGQAHFLLGDLADAQRHFAECVELARGQTDGEALRSGLFGLGRVAILLGRSDEADLALAEAATKAEEMSDGDDLATAVGLLGDLARARGDWDRAGELIKESTRLAGEGGTRVGAARALYFTARLAEAQSVDGDNGAGELFAEALSLVRDADGLGFHDVRCLLGLGWAAEARGDRRTAAGRLLEALAMAQAIGDTQAAAQSHVQLSGLARRDGRLEEADSLAQRGLAIHHQVGDLAGLAASLDSVAGTAVESERWQVAARLLASAQALLDTAGYVRSNTDDAYLQQDLDRVRTALGEKDFATAWSEGASLSPDEAATYAMRGRGGRDRPVSGWDSLTPAERQVTTLVGEGLTNPEVGRRLFVSPRTVGHHLAHVYQKLGIHSRGALIKELAGREAQTR